MFNLLETAPWGAVLVVVVLLIVVSGLTALARALWPQNSCDRKELWQGWQRERARRRRQINGRE